MIMSKIDPQKLFRFEVCHFAMRKIVIPSILITMVIYAKTLYWMIGSWIMNPYYSHGFLVLLVSSYFVYKNVGNLKRNDNPLGLMVYSLALFIHVLAFVYDYDFVSAMSFPFAIFGLIYTFYGSSAKELAFPLLFLLFAVPYPIYSISNVLEVFSAQLSVGIVKLMGVNAKVEGAEIYLTNCAFVVGAPCSGIRSIIALLTVSTLYSYLINDRYPVKIVLVLASIPVALFANVLRISTILISAEFVGKDFAMGMVHYASDLVLFAIAVFFLVLLRRCLRWILRVIS